MPRGLSDFHSAYRTDAEDVTASCAECVFHQRNKVIQQINWNKVLGGAAESAAVHPPGPLPCQQIFR